MAERGLSGSTGGSGGAPNGLTEVDLGPGVSAVFTTAAFDLADAAGRAALAAALGRPLVFANQVHGARLEWIDSLASGRPTCDALASGEHGIGLVIRTADCVPVLLADVDAGIVAAAHAGWRGLLGGVLDAAVGGLRQRGARRIGAAIGPAICGDCYVVGEDLAARAAGAGHVTRLGAD
ncbi:MAG: polyphenol oxidase family protein, partial [Bifidobacteriaceae bacterium]|nr:polyphenol oxidase family protein [Bifidobacteriaceae bacterium]